MGYELEKFIITLDNTDYLTIGGDSEDDFSGAMSERPTYDKSEAKGKKKNFGEKKAGYQKEFIPSEELKPEMWRTNGFMLDKNLNKLQKLMKEKGIDAKTINTKESDQICAAAIQENRIFITSNLKLFNKKLQMPRCCLFYKSSPQSKPISPYF